MDRPARRLRAFQALAFATLVVLPALAGASSAFALEECRLLRQPDIEGKLIVFVYGGDLWTVPRQGGAATRLTKHEGIERFPKFSPDGKRIAMTAEYDGNTDAFVIPAEGGEPVRLTWHPDGDVVAEWYPDGKSILLRSTRATTLARVDRFYRVPAAGGFEDELPLKAAGYATFSGDGGKIAFVSPSYDFRTWKRYRGGNAPDIWIYDFVKTASEKVTDWAGPDEWPMWYRNTIYYASDRGGRVANLWAYDVDKKTHRQVTKFTDYDVKWPSIGSDAIVFENGGYLYVLDLPSEKANKIQVLVPDDKPDARAEYKDVARWVGAWDLSPSGKRAVIEARGDVFTVPVEKGEVRNLSRSPGSRERDPVWSPDGKWIAYLSDASGEYELHVAGSDGKTPDRQVTRTPQPTFRFAPVWSPDSKKVAFSDKTWALWWCDVATGKLTKVDKSDIGQITQYVWSGDSRFIAYAFPAPNYMNAVRLYGLDTGKVTQVSTGMFDDFSPSFDAEGKALFFVSRRTLRPEFGVFETDFQFLATDKIYAVTLRADAPSPVAPQSDEEGEAADSKEGGDGDKGDKDAATDDKKKDAGKDAKKDAATKDSSKDAAAKPWTIDLDGIASRVAEIPVPAGRYVNVRAFKGKILYQAIDLASGEPADPETQTAAVHSYDLEKRKDVVIVAGVEPAYATSKDGGKVLYKSGDTFGVIDDAEGKKIGDGKIEGTVNLKMLVDPRQEWKQMFEEAWRLERDFYYDPAMGGIDWKGMGERYRQLVPYVAHRADLNYILGELIGELSTSHTYVGGGDAPQTPQVDVGLLGVDYALDAKSGRYKFAKIYRERDWNAPESAPLGEPGVQVKEGDYLLAVDGVPLKSPTNVYAAFVGTAHRQTVITVGSRPDDPAPRTYTVTPIAHERSLRYTAWVADNRRKVAEATGGRVAYVHVPDTAISGIQEFAKQMYPQSDREGLIVDERFNGGGLIPDFFINRLRQKTWTYWSSRDGLDFRTPAGTIDGPRCILINQYAGSGGDAFPYYFRQQGLGPIIGKRTWGGLVGISQNLPLVDGGAVTMPDFGMWDPKSGWAVENHGVDPDIEVENTPDAMAAGRDPQLERAIQYVLDELKAHPYKRPERPKYKVRTADVERDNP